ncbi:MAG TPA: alpha/beta fold hydrolase [Vicinamibacteria bacterium]|nr:alpha/beta fold hydrolase [Vicinamibacteria bacterium]
MRARVDGGAIEYDARGEGRTLLLLHAFPLGLSMWEPQCEALSPRLRVVRFDARGFGGSDPVPGPLTMERIAEDAIALLDLLGIDRAVVGGCSMGGYAALALARRHPHRLSGLVLQDTRAGADTEEARAGRRQLASRVLETGPAAAAEAFLPRLLGETTRRERPDLVGELRERILATPASAIASALHGLAEREDSRPTLAALHVPTLVLVGEEDVITPPSEAEAMARAVRRARLVRVPRAGHLSNLENPEAVNAALAEFLGGLRG